MGHYAVLIACFLAYAALWSLDALATEMWFEIYDRDGRPRRG